MNSALLTLIEFAILAVFHTFLGVGTCNFQDITQLSVAFTTIYFILILWGLHIGNTVALQCRKNKDQLTNPSLAGKFPGYIFIAHNFICVLHVLVLGPYFLASGLRKWYWTSFVAMLFGSMPIVQFNYMPESFGKAVGTFVVFRNVAEMLLSLYLATTLGDDDESFKMLSIYHFWIWGYRLLDVGPRRLMVSMLLPSIQILAVLIILYIGTFFALQENLLLFAGVPPCWQKSALEEESWLMHAGRILFCAVVYMVFYILQKGYVKEVASAGHYEVHPDPPEGTHDEKVKQARGYYQRLQ